MQNLCAIVLVLVFEFSFGQLSIRNDAFVFVEGTVMYVEDDVNLEESTATIYLRDEAQLVQGAGTTGNSGIGKLSIYQYGTVNQYAFNYWCSPVGNTTSNNNINISFRPNSQIYDVTSPPITSTPATFTSGYDGTSSPLVISSRWLYTYDPGIAYTDWDYIGESGDALPGYGFTMKGTSGSSEHQLYDFRGKPNNGTIATTVATGQQTLVGNPYPSAIDALDFINDKNNTKAITGVLYYWEQEAGASSHILEDYVGGYASYTIDAFGVESFTPAPFSAYLSDGTAVNLPFPTNGLKIAKRYIPVGQGFMVEGKNGSSGTLYMKNSYREFYKESGSESYFFRTNDGTSSKEEITNSNEALNDIPDDYKRFRINVDFNETYTRQLLMNFHPSASNGFDYGLEGKTSNVLKSDAFWVLDKEPYNIQAFDFDEDLKIPLVVTLDEQQFITFRIFDVQNFGDYKAIYLHDIEENIYIDLTSQNYTVNLSNGNFDNRFEITFRDASLGISKDSIGYFNVFQNNNLSQLIILNPKKLEVLGITVFDNLGRQVLSKQIQSDKENFSISTKNLSNGVYFAKVIFHNQNFFNKKIIISQKQ